ncbi:hypothetical protein T440DRAFT_65745 [Plenodomus tracheiphilus IPT5]|uniref:Transmembrane protein n=1 Tax=Plenodomus tracheiphilus IPT5 TaxID=1408161 RepID=A0A6A7B840_9PLEO|nr:hypothetical protein T440DRAFT_65745 [Plenodomus tracheiphilus IPT5]
MPPQPESTHRFCIDTGAISTPSPRFFALVLLVTLLATAARSIVAFVTRRKSRMADSRLGLDKILNPARPTLRREDSKIEVKRISKSPKSNTELDLNSYLQSLQEEALQPHLAPVHPWIAPPTPLPGPYDAPYYPLPLPTVQSASQEPTAVEFQETFTRSYTRRPSANSELSAETVLEGSTTVSTQGWRRTQWNVTAG